MIKAPFTPDQVAALNRFQHSGLGHPFTCGSGRRTDATHLDREGVLVATEAGWKCPYCDYTQDWAHEEMVAEAPLHTMSFPKMAAEFLLENDRLTKALHAAEKHPDYSYITMPPGVRYGPNAETLGDLGYERNLESETEQRKGIDECWRRRKEPC